MFTWNNYKLTNSLNCRTVNNVTDKQNKLIFKTSTFNISHAHDYNKRIINMQPTQTAYALFNIAKPRLVGFPQAVFRVRTRVADLFDARKATIFHCVLLQLWHCSSSSPAQNCRNDRHSAICGISCTRSFRGIVAFRGRYTYSRRYKW